MPTGIIESLDHEARGVTRLDGKTVFVEGALPGELVEYAGYRRKPTYELARTLQVIKASASRVSPRCPHFGVCGGCSLQHLEAAAQVAAKQRLLEDNLWHLGRIRAEQLYAPIHGAAWAYRYRARLSVRFVAKKGGVLVGFHEKKSSYVADMRQCEILPPNLSALLLPLRELIGQLSIRDRLPQIEVAVGERITALVLRILEPLSPADEILLRNFADDRAVVFYLQPQGPATAYRFHPLGAPPLSYLLPDFAVEHSFSPTEFTQVNHAINRVLVRRAINLLAPQPGECIADMFCGLGNFTLPIARSGARVTGVEGSSELVRRAAENAAANGLRGLVDYRIANLFETTAELLATLGHCDKMLIDPPREGALELVKALGADGPWRIVYISCSPATLARDAGILVGQKGYRLRGAGVVNMFPQTSHVESIALFERPALAAG
ncbi:MAG: 23S rRNA (uracil(1939)-C(5))-methyltransferase RlmD [Candidatus Accumulibacter sp.]|uniref:23S rRNA (uracil(1939)-C(5))-methyltransferase RlmD n=1 Tax=Accumulibacter sp. TaxID=2053492 RepID=UPI001A5E3508|nr:23S rRNA (uracil(1939)-C(5))-methyltransferase RlmD [Accumulibacter sp.]MBL8394322.1 23S rRNA (uracil(1939)-C(5))-methyltransferase RlmD [Accumulibacter sp.]